MATVKENLIAARALIDTPEKWGKGKGNVGPKGCLCALGALGRVRDADWREADALFDALEGRWEDRSVHAFNDHPDTTHADVMALYDRAIAAQQDEAA